MLVEQEKQRQVARFQTILRDTDRRIWRQASFPGAHRPDIDFLASHLQMDSRLPIIYTPHTDMLPDIQEQVLKNIAESTIAFAENKVAYYEPATRTTVIMEKFLGAPDRMIQTTLWHEAATDRSNRLKIINPDMYTPEQQAVITVSLETFFSPGNRPDLKETTIQKSGFTEQLFHNGMIISRLSSPLLDPVDEIYPTAFEVITDQITKRAGDIERFDWDIAQGNAVPVDTLNHPEFSAMLLRAFEVIDWRHILDAYVTGDFNQVTEVLEKSEKMHDVSSGVFLELMETMKRDEKGIVETNEAFYEGAPVIIFFPS